MLILHSFVRLFFRSSVRILSDISWSFGSDHEELLFCVIRYESFAKHSCLLSTVHFKMCLFFTC